MIRVRGESSNLRTTTLKAIMERNSESRIRTVQKNNDRLWVTLYHSLSKLKPDLINVINDYVNNLKDYYDSVIVEKLDVKYDYFGSFQVDVSKAKSHFREAI